MKVYRPTSGNSDEVICIMSTAELGSIKQLVAEYVGYPHTQEGYDIEVYTDIYNEVH